MGLINLFSLWPTGTMLLVVTLLTLQMAPLNEGCVHIWQLEYKISLLALRIKKLDLRFSFNLLRIRNIFMWSQHEFHYDLFLIFSCSCSGISHSTSLELEKRLVMLFTCNSPTLLKAKHKFAVLT